MFTCFENRCEYPLCVCVRRWKRLNTKEDIFVDGGSEMKSLVGKIM